MTLGTVADGANAVKLYVCIFGGISSRGVRYKEMSASERFLTRNRQTPAFTIPTPYEARIVSMVIYTKKGGYEYEFPTDTLMVRDGEKFLVERAQGRLNVYRLKPQEELEKELERVKTK